MAGYAVPAVQGAPPLTGSGRRAAASVLGSGGSPVPGAKTGCDAPPAAHGFGLIAASPADRSWLVPVVPQAGLTWPETSEPSAQTAVLETAFTPAAHAPPPPTQICPPA